MLRSVCKAAPRGRPMARHFSTLVDGPKHTTKNKTKNLSTVAQQQEQEVEQQQQQQTGPAVQWVKTSPGDPMPAREILADKLQGLPGVRLPKLKMMIEQLRGKRPVRIMETHSGLSGLVAESAKSRHIETGEVVEFDGMWSSSLTASAVQGKPDIEAVDTTARLAVVKETLEVTSKPLIYDGDTGGQPEIFRFTVRTLENLGVSAVIIEDKTGLKQNSLFGTDRKQVLEDLDLFCDKIRAGVAAKRSPDFMVIARMESLIAGHGQVECLRRALASIEAGADAIMIHSKEKDPTEVLEFLRNYHEALGERAVPVIAVPTTYNSLTERDLVDAGVSVCIYANHLLRAAYPAMLETAENILANGRSLECDQQLLPVKKILTLINENPMNPDAKPVSVSSSPTAAEMTPAEDARVKVDPEAAFEHLQTLGVTSYFGVPDSLLAPFCQVVSEKADQHVITANEGAAVATAAGHHLATGEVPLVYMQNSGLGNAVNPLLSLAHKDVYGTPMVVMVGWRGAPGTKDEPQHVVQGRLTATMCQGMEFKTLTLPAQGDAEARAVLDEAVASAKESQQPVVLLVPPKTFAGTKNLAEESQGPRATREEALEAVLANCVKPGDAVVSTTGYASREVYELRQRLGQSHASDFLTVGSMGHAIAIAQGVAMAQPDRTVWCLDGDGSSLMHLGSMATSAAFCGSNLRHVVLNNEVHDSVGAQPTAAAKGKLDFTQLAGSVGYSAVPRVTTAEGLKAACDELSSEGKQKGPRFMEVQIKLGVRSDLGRPKTTTQDAKKAFMEYLSEPVQSRL